MAKKKGVDLVDGAFVSEPVPRKPEDVKRLMAALVNAANDAKSGYGGKTLVTASEITARLPVCRTGVFELDVALSGGYRFGDTMVLWGATDSGKTYLCRNVVARAQRSTCANCHRPANVEVGLVNLKKQNPNTGEVEDVPVWRIDEDKSSCPNCGSYRKMNVLWVDSANSFEPELAFNQGICVEDVTIIRPPTVESVTDMVMEPVESGYVDFLVVDDIPNLPAGEVLTKSAGDELTQALMARRLVRFLTKYNAANLQCGRKWGRCCSLIVCNQEAANITPNKYAPKTIKPGGMRQSFQAKIIVQMTSRKIEYAKAGKSEDKDRPVLSLCRGKIEKVKAGTVGRSFEFGICLVDGRYYKKGETLSVESTYQWAMKMNILGREGKEWILAYRDRFGEDRVRKFDKKEQILPALKAEKDMCIDIQNFLLPLIVKELSTDGSAVEVDGDVDSGDGGADDEPILDGDVDEEEGGI